MIRKLIPTNIKITYHQLLRYWKERVIHRFDFARSKDELLKQQLSITLDVKVTDSYENKWHNLQLGAERITGLVLYPGQVFSFWKIVRRPTKNNGYRKSRNIKDGKLAEDYGGGLCQLSGLIYYLALKSGLKVLERYNHSIDIYTEETRFTPLGTDATVVYGYKDLMIQNNKEHPIQFNIELMPESIIGNVLSQFEIQEVDLEISLTKSENFKNAKVSDNNGNLLNQSRYRIPTS